jgi:dinuclear metal center YbgI/SA1388 family protein
MLRLKELDALIDTIAPRELAESWDNVGLQVGDPDAPVKRLALAVDVTKDTVQKAIRLRADALISHHPLIFRPLHTLILSNPVSKLLRDLLAHGIALIVAHTNLDKSPEGTNKALACALGVENPQPLLPQPAGVQHYKFVVFVPKGYEAKIIDAIHRGGGGVIGNYSHCTFRTSGTGTFLPLEGAKPFIGAVGQLEEAEEWRLEALVPKAKIHAVLREVIRVHPYEEVAYDVFPLEAISLKSGLGMVGELANQLAFSTFLRKLKTALKPQTVQLIGVPPRRLRRVAVCSGAGGDVIPHLAPDRADLLVTGEINHHAALEAQARGLCVVCATHYATELPGMRHLAQLLRRHDRIRREKIIISLL